MIFKAKYLKSLEIDILKKHFETVKINSDYQMVFENQIPPMAILLLKGNINLKYKKKIERLVEPGVLMGIFHILNNHPAALGCEISAQSEILLIYKSELLEIAHAQSSDLMKLILAV